MENDQALENQFEPLEFEETKEVISIDKLKSDFGPPVHVPLHGECIVVPGDLFDPDWEACLADQGYVCYESKVEGKPVTYVRLAKILGINHTPPKPAKVESKIEVTNGGEKEKMEMENIVNLEKEEPVVSSNPVEKKKYSLKKPDWTKEQIADLLNEYDKLVSDCKKYGAAKTLAEMPKFQNRTANAIHVKLGRLLRKRKKIEPLVKIEKAKPTAKAKKEITPKPKNTYMRSPEDRWTPYEDELLIILWNKTPRIDMSEVCVQFKKAFPMRSAKSVDYRIAALQHKGKIQQRKKSKKTIEKSSDTVKDTQKISTTESTPAIMENVKSIDTTFKGLSKPEELEPKLDDADVLLSLATEVQTLREAYDKLSKAYIELHNEFYGIKSGIADLANEIDEIKSTDLEQKIRNVVKIVEIQAADLEGKIKNVAAAVAQCPTDNDLEILKTNLALHEHAKKSGRTMIPMEA